MGFEFELRSNPKRDPTQKEHVSMSEKSNGRKVGIAAASHVYGPASVHLLPCRIDHTGPAPVAQYFQPQSQPDEPSKLNTTSEGSGFRNGAEKNDPDGAAKVRQRVEPDDGEITSHFRGRKMMGRVVNLPGDVHGVVLREHKCPVGVREADRDITSFWAAETTFSKITVWGHDVVPTESTVERCLAWMDVSRSV
ncbi:unnamed protein product, partial [Discosporangium mesarthrocarpum]